MTAAYNFTVAIWLPLINTLLIAATALYCWRRRDVPAALPLFANYVVSIIFLLAGMLQTAAVDPATGIFWYKFQAAVLAFGPATLTCFVLEFVYPGRWLTRRNVALLFAPAVLYVILIAVDGSRMVWRQLAVAPDGTLLAEPTAAVLLMNSYAAVLDVIDGVALIWLFVRSPSHRWAVGLLFFPVFVIRTPFVLSLLDLDLPVPLDLVAIGRILTYLAGVVALFGFRIFDPLPAARRAVIEQMRAGALVFDPRGRVLSANPAAEAILGVPAEAARGKLWQEITHAQPLNLSASGNPAGGATELPDMVFGIGPGTRSCAPALSELKDFRGLLLGHLLLLRDVTDQRRAQAQALAQALEQRWAQATLQERAQLAHELHDGVSQSLAFLNVQAQAAELYAETGQDDEARAALSRLAEVARAMQAEVRELIGNLLEVSLPSEGFAGTLRHIVAQYQERNGIPVSLEMDDPTGRLANGSGLTAETGVQLVRIVQEALANAAKHAAADQVSVGVRVADGQVQLVITDNGKGFDTSGARPEGEHFGLQVMRERAERVGGGLVVCSAPGQGTRVEVCAALIAAQLQPAPLGIGREEVAA